MGSSRRSGGGRPHRVEQIGDWTCSRTGSRRVGRRSVMGPERGVWEIWDFHSGGHHGAGGGTVGGRGSRSGELPRLWQCAGGLPETSGRFGYRLCLCVTTHAPSKSHDTNVRPGLHDEYL